MNASERIIVALDTEPEHARRLAEQLRGTAQWLKVGMTLYYAAGPSIVEEFKEQGYNIFVDLKLHDIPHQVEGAARVIAVAGADMLTVHAAGGTAMMQAACRGAEDGQGARAAKRAGTKAEPERRRPLCLGITVLTSLDSAALAAGGIFADTPATQVLRMARLAREAGMDGVVCAPTETAMLRAELGATLALVTPGVRPEGSAKDDQARVATPAQALKAGADYLVIGRPIVKAADPLAAFIQITKEMEA